MTNNDKRNLRLGLFVTLGLIIFTAAIYYIGSRQNLFGGNTRVVAVFENVGGLQVGNIVRFSGINIGTVDGIRIVSDSTVQVSMLIDNKVSVYIKKDSEATIGSEGLMGNKLVTISSGSASAPSIEDDDQLATFQGADIDEVINLMRETGENAKIIMANLAEISEDIKTGRGTLGKLISDTIMVDKFDEIMFTIQRSGNNAARITNDIAAISSEIKSGEGTLGKLIMDPEMMQTVTKILDSLQYTSSRSANVMQNLETFSGKLNNQEGVLGKVLTDTAFAENVEATMIKAQNAADGVEKATSKLNSSWLFNIFTGRDKSKKD